MDDFITAYLFTQDIAPLVDARTRIQMGIVVLIAGIGMILISVTKPKWLIAGGWETFLRPGIFVSFWALLWVGLSLAVYGPYAQQYERLENIYNSQSYEVAEGIVRVVSIQPKGGHTPGDIVQIDDVEFEINFYSGELGYRTSITHGGILTEGKYVRVYYYKGTILRIDLQQ